MGEAEDAVEVIVSECLAHRTRLLNRTVTSLYDEALRPLGLTVAHLNMLVAIAFFGPVAPGKLAERLNMEKSTMSRNVARLSGLGQIEVKAGSSGREQQLQVLSKGSKLIERALPLWRSAQARTIAMLGDRGVQAVRDAASSAQGS